METSYLQITQKPKNLFNHCEIQYSMKYQYLEEENNWGFPDWNRSIEILSNLPEKDFCSPPVTRSSEAVRK